MRRITLLILYLLIGHAFSIGQKPVSNIRFEQITINDGLSLSSVYTIFQDSKGFMWFGTEDGLNKYDGDNFTIFRPHPSGENCISHKWIEQITEDHLGYLWFGSKGGLSRLDPKSEQFIHYRQELELPFKIRNDTITWIQPIENWLWIGHLDGIDRIDLESGHSIPEQNEKGDQVTGRVHQMGQFSDSMLFIATDDGLFSYHFLDSLFKKIDISPLDQNETHVYTVLADNGNILLGTDRGLVIYNSSDGSSEVLQLPRVGVYSNRSVRYIHKDQGGIIWLVGDEGLYSYSQSEKSVRQWVHSPDNTHSLSINTTMPLFEDRQGSLWFGTFGSGLFRIDRQTGWISTYRENAADPQSLAQNSINCIFEDNAGIMWYGTFGAGISLYDPQSHLFELLRHDPLSPDGLASNFVWSILEDRQGRIWIGTNDRGINVYSPESEEFVLYDYSPGRRGGISNSSVRELFQDSRGRIWIGTDGGGVNLYLPESDDFVVFSHDTENPNSISGNSVRVVFEDNNGIIWIGTRQGLNRFIPENGIFERYVHRPGDSTSLSHNFIYSSMIQDEEGFIWIGTYGGGLNRFNPTTGIFKHYLNRPEDEHSISDDIVFSIYQQDDSIFWIGTNNGLNRFNKVTGIFTRFGLEEGLPNEVVYSVLPDEIGYIWMSTNLGICRFHPEEYSVLNFDVHDGLQSNEFNGGAYHKGIISGTLYFGGVQGLNMVDPSIVTPRTNHTTVVFTKLNILGREIAVERQETDFQPGQDPGETRIYGTEDNYRMSRNISYVDHLVLTYKQRFFSVEFSALNSSQNDNVSYEIFVENLHEGWQSAGRRNYESFSGLNPGNYTILVRSVNHHGIRGQSTAKLQVTIIPPFWRSYWFKGVVILFIFAVVGLFYHYALKIRTSRILKAKNEKIRQANQQLAESERILKELNATKDKFFSIISHDLKNPLSSLISISDALLQYKDPSDTALQEKGIQEIHNSIMEINRLLENLLTWSKSQRGKLEFQPVDFNLSVLLQETINLYRTAAEKKGISLVVDFEDGLFVHGDREMIHTATRNLVNNAIKFTVQGGRISLGAMAKKGHVTVTVEDNGLGIPPENLKKLFRIDEKVKTKGTAGEQGSGLGLILCKEFIEKNHGTLHAESEEGKGSCFWFTIPAGKGSNPGLL